MNIMRGEFIIRMTLHATLRESSWKITIVRLSEFCRKLHVWVVTTALNNELARQYNFRTDNNSAHVYANEHVTQSMKANEY